jgi:hypothetical protein
LKPQVQILVAQHERPSVTFLLDFGFKPYKQLGKKTYGGYGIEPFVYCAVESDKDSFGGAAFVVETEEDLKLTSSVLPGATEVYEMEDAPGGGKAITFHCLLTVAPGEVERQDSCVPIILYFLLFESIKGRSDLFSHPEHLSRLKKG